LGYARRCIRECDQCRCAHVANTAASQAAFLPEGGHFFVSRELATLGLREPFENRRAMIVGDDEQIAASGSNLFKDFGDIGLPIPRQLPHLLDRVFQNLGHRLILQRLLTKRELSVPPYPRCFLKYSVARPQACSAHLRSCTDMRCSLAKPCSAS